MKINIHFILISIAILSGVISCENVADGYRIDYEESNADFSVELLTPDRGAIGDTISFSIKAIAEADIKSMVVSTSVSGDAGSGYEIDKAYADPFIDHTFGTIQPNTKELNLIYHYIVEQDSLDAELTFIFIDGIGKKSVEYDTYTVPSIVKFNKVALYTKTSVKTDGLSTIDGMVYHDLSKYSDVTEVNNRIQESLDIIALVNNDNAMLVAPYNGNYTGSISIRNKTLFKKLDDVGHEDFENITSASLSVLVEENEVKKGSTSISGIKVGDMIGFRTDFASANPYHFGLLKINAIHPATIEHYEGTSYVIEMDMATQK